MSRGLKSEPKHTQRELERGQMTAEGKQKPTGAVGHHFLKKAFLIHLNYMKGNLENSRKVYRTLFKVWGY